MASQGGKGKRKREHKVSRGVHGGSQKVRLNEVQKVLMGGGLLRNAARREYDKTGHR